MYFHHLLLYAVNSLFIYFHISVEITPTLPCFTPLLLLLLNQIKKISCHASRHLHVIISNPLWIKWCWQLITSPLPSPFIGWSMLMSWAWPAGWSVPELQHKASSLLAYNQRAAGCEDSAITFTFIFSTLSAETVKQLLAKTAPVKWVCYRNLTYPNPFGSESLHTGPVLSFLWFGTLLNNNSGNKAASNSKLCKVLV